MLKTVQLSALSLALVGSFGTAHAFGINDDIASCAAAISEAELLGDAEYNLDFVSDQGKRSRVLTLEANVVGADDVIIECRMSRSNVKEVVIVEAE